MYKEDLELNEFSYNLNPDKDGGPDHGGEGEGGGDGEDGDED